MNKRNAGAYVLFAANCWTCTDIKYIYTPDAKDVFLRASYLPHTLFLVLELHVDVTVFGICIRGELGRTFEGMPHSVERRRGFSKVK